MKFHNRYFIFSFGLYMAIILLVPVTCWSQPQRLEESRYFPPEFLSKDQTDASLASLRWQLEQYEHMVARYTKSKTEISVNIADLSAKIAALKKQVPAELRFMDNSVRSRLVGKAMEQMLDSQLELATLEQSIVELETKYDDDKNSRLNKLRQAELETEVSVAARRYKLAQSELANMKKLRKSNSIAEQEMLRAETAAEIAQIEFQSARTRAEIEKERNNVESATELAEKRILVEPVKSRIQTIEKFLKSFSEAADETAEIEILTRQRELWQKDLQLVAIELFKMNTKMAELQALKMLIEEKVKNVGSEMPKD